MRNGAKQYPAINKWNDLHYWKDTIQQQQEIINDTYYVDLEMGPYDNNTERTMKNVPFEQ